MGQGIQDSLNRLALLLKAGLFQRVCGFFNKIRDGVSQIFHIVHLNRILLCFIKMILEFSKFFHKYLYFFLIRRNRWFILVRALALHFLIQGLEVVQPLVNLIILKYIMNHQDIIIDFSNDGLMR